MISTASFTGSALFVCIGTAAMELIDSVFEWADKGGKLGAQALLILILIIVIWLFLKGQKEAHSEREKLQKSRDEAVLEHRKNFKDLKDTCDGVLKHHEAFASQMQREREEMNREREEKFMIIVSLQRETNAALNGNTGALTTLSRIVESKL